jgi:hypothetical protein
MLKWGPYPITQYRGFPGVVVVRCPGAGSCRCRWALGVGRWAPSPSPSRFPPFPFPFPLPASRFRFRFPLPLPVPVPELLFASASASAECSVQCQCHVPSYIIHHTSNATCHQSPITKSQNPKEQKSKRAHSTCNMQHATRLGRPLAAAGHPTAGRCGRVVPVLPLLLCTCTRPARELGLLLGVKVKARPPAPRASSRGVLLPGAGALAGYRTQIPAGLLIETAVARAAK